MLGTTTTTITTHCLRKYEVWRFYLIGSELKLTLISRYRDIDIRLQNVDI